MDICVIFIVVMVSWVSTHVKTQMYILNVCDLFYVCHTAVKLEKYCALNLSYYFPHLTQ